jgi:hypothetical protein
LSYPLLNIFNQHKEPALPQEILFALQGIYEHYDTFCIIAVQRILNWTVFFRIMKYPNISLHVSPDAQDSKKPKKIVNPT